MRWRSIWLIAVFSFLTGLSAVQAQTARVALVIGNGAYQRLAPLANSVADATALAGRLSDLGFEIHLHTDLTMRGMVDALKAFRDAAAGADFALVFYAGHGRQATSGDGVVRNYLFPVDARPDRPIDLAREAMTVDELFATYLEEAGAGETLVLLDAGRPVVLWDEAARAEGRAHAEPGFAAALPQTAEWFDYEIWYASAPGAVAHDGPAGASSPFATALMAALEVPGLDTDALFRRVAAHMRQAPDLQQRPTPFGRLGTPVVIHQAVPSPDGPPAQGAAEPAAVEAAPEHAASLPEPDAPAADEPAESVAANAEAAAPSSRLAVLDDPAFAAFPEMFEPAADGPTGEQLEALVAWSRLQLEAGQVDGAITALEQALEYDPENLEAWLVLNDALLARGDYRRAMDTYRERMVRELEPSTLIVVADVLDQAGHPSQATMSLLLAFATAEASGDAAGSAQARARIDSLAAEIAAERAGARLAAAWAALEDGRYAEAERAHAQILGASPEMADDPELGLLAAGIADGLGRAEEAERLYASVAEADAGGAFGTRAEQSLAVLRAAREIADTEDDEREALARADQIPAAALQWALKALGHYEGPVDDDFGPTSRTAALAFQERIGAERTGDLTNAQKVQLVTMAAEAGQAESQNTLGIMYATGVGVGTDIDQARLWWERAADQDFTKAEENLARLSRQ